MSASKANVASGSRKKEFGLEVADVANAVVTRIWMLQELKAIKPDAALELELRLGSFRADSDSFDANLPYGKFSSVVRKFNSVFGAPSQRTEQEYNFGAVRPLLDRLRVANALSPSALTKNLDLSPEDKAKLSPEDKTLIGLLAKLPPAVVFGDSPQIRINDNNAAIFSKVSREITDFVYQSMRLSSAQEISIPVEAKEDALKAAAMAIRRFAPRGEQTTRNKVIQSFDRQWWRIDCYVVYLNPGTEWHIELELKQQSLLPQASRAEIVREFKEIVSLIKSLRSAEDLTQLACKSLGLNNVRQLFSLPVAMMNRPAIVANCLSRNYTITDKADGLRRILYINGSVVHFIERNESVQEQVFVAESKSTSGLISQLCCMLDCELVGSTYYVFDALMSDNKSLLKAGLFQRLEAALRAQMLLEQLKALGSTLDVKMKTFHTHTDIPIPAALIDSKVVIGHASQQSYLAIPEKILASAKYTIDGIIYTPITEPYFQSSEFPIYKWKTSHTVDVRLVPNGLVESGESGEQTMECRVWDRDREIPLEHMGIPVVVVAPTDAAGSICEISPSLTAARLEWKFIKIRTDKSGENDRPNAVATARQAIDSTENPVVLSDLQSYTQGETSPDLIRDVFPRVFPTDNHIPETADAVITPNLISNLNYLKRIAADKSRLLDSYKNQQEFENLLGYKTGKRGVKFITNAYLKAIEILAPIIAERAAADKSYIVSQFDNASFPGSWIFAVRALATHNNLTHNWVASSYHQNVAALGDEFKLAEQFPEKILMLQEPVVDGDLRSAATALEIARRAKPHGVNLYTSDLGMGVLDLPLFFYKTPTTVLGKPFAVESPHIIASMQLNDNATMLISDQPLELKTVEPLVIPKADREEWAYTLQEQLHTRAHLGQAVCGLASLAPGGDIILKHYSLTTGLTQQIIAMLSSCFETAVIQKPLTSSGDNSECYFVGRGYKPNAAVLELLSNHLRNWSHQSINLVADEPLKKRLAVVAGIGARLIYSQCAYIRYHLGAPPKHLMVINGWTSVVNGRFSVATITTGPGLSDLEAHRAGRAKFAYDREKVAPEVGPVSQENQPVVLSVADAVAPSADTAAKLEAGRFAIATLVMGDPKYVLGAMALAQSLRLAGTRAQLVVMVETRLLQDKALEIALKTVFNKVYPVELLSYQTYMAGMTERQQTMYSSWISHSYTKWNCLRLPYEKVLMMDADTVAVQNLDHLFDMDAPSGSFHSPWFKSYQNEKGEPLAHGDLVPVEWIRNGLDGILTQEQRREFAQGREQGRVQRQKAERFFVAFATSMLLPGGLSAAAAGNSDKIFIEFNNFLIRESSRSQYGYGHKCNSGADEQSIVEFFNSKRHRWHDIGPAYNCIPRHSHMVPSGKVFVIHYHGTNPWDAKPGAWEDMVWWSKVVQSSDAFSQRMQALGSTLSATYFTGVINRNYRVAGVAGELKNSVVSYINRNRLADSAQSIREIGNLVKRSVINSVCQGLSILDLGFGEGGDIHKYASAKISQLIGIEPNAQRIELAKIRMQKVPAINSIATIHQGSGDDLSLINRAVVKPVDVVASFFSLSFFFGSQQQLKNLCECIDTALVPGGYFIGTTVDGTAVLSLLAEVGSKGRYESKSLGLYIEACEIPDGRKMPEYGDQIIWDLDSKTATRHHEYLVNLDRLSRELKQRGINMISGGPFPQTSQNGEIDKYNSMFQWFVYQKGRAVPTTAAVANVIAVSSTTSSSSSSSEPVERHSVESILAARGDVIIDVRVKKSMGINQDIQVIKAIGIAGHYFIQDTPDPDRFERIAAPTILVVNHEFMSDWNLKNIAAGKIDLVWCKTAEGYRQVVKLLKRHHLENMVKRVRNLGFTTLLPRELVYGSHEKNWHLWGHYAGKSNMKNSLAVLSAWSMAMVAKDFGGYSGKDFGKQNLLVITLAKSEDTKATKEIVKFYSKIDEVIDEQKDKAVKKAYLAPGVKIDGISLPACYLISPVIEGGNLVGGCAVFPEYLPVAEFQQLQQRTGWVIAPSAMEGYGHYINTARALSSPVISVDVAPMNELVDTRTGLLIPVDAKHMEKMKGLYVPQGYEVAVARPDKKDILDAVGRAAAISSSKARDLGLAGNREFHRQQTQVLGEYIQQPTTEIGRFSFSHRAEADQICEVLRDTIPTPKTIADITAGQGGVFFALHHWFPEAKFVAIEKSEDEFKHLAANAQRLGYSEAELVRGQAQDPDLYSRADLVFMDPPWGGPEYKNAAVVPMELENAGNFIQWLASVKDRLPATVAIKAPLNWDIAAATKVFDNWRLSSHDIYSWKEPGKVAYRLHIAQRNA